MKDKIHTWLKQFNTFFRSFQAKLAEQLAPVGKKLKPFVEKLKPYVDRYWPMLRKPVIALLFLFLFGLIGIWGFYLSVRWGFFERIPSRKELRDVRNHEASEVYSADGVLLGRYYLEDRTNVAYDNISENVVNALISTEDSRFYTHGGVDVKSVLRVFFKSILMRDERSGGGSTISQQLAKNLFPRQPHGVFTMPVAKVKEMIIAGRLEALYSKKEILTMYLNTVAFGDNAYGIDRAAYRFFSSSANELKIEEAAVLIGLLKATTYYNPRNHPERSLQRRNQVIDQMMIYGDLDRPTGDSLKAMPLGLKYNLVSQSEGLAPYFREHLRQELNKWCSEKFKKDGTPYNLYTDGLKIHTTIDSKLQQYAQEAVHEHMTDLQKTFDKHWAGKRPWGKDLSTIEQAVTNSERYQIRKAAGWTQEQLNQDFQTKRKIIIFTHEGEKEVEMSPMDSIIHYMYFLNTGFLSMNPANGHVKAWVGGINHTYYKYDHVKTRRQVGSTFKPIVYLAALEQGGDPCSFYPNEQIEYAKYKNWKPGNSDGEYGGEYSMKGALVKSVNTVAVQLIMKTGIKPVIELAEDMGIDENTIPEVPSIALGTSEVTLYEMMKVYGTIANYGYRVEPVYLELIEDRKGRTIEKFDIRYPKKEQVLDPEDAALMLEMMQMVVDSGTAQRIRWKYKLKNDVAGKTGTTQQHSDGWFMGITPKLIAGVWVGGANNHIRFRSTSLGQGANMALPIWALFFKRINEDKDYKMATNARFPAPDSSITNLLKCPMFYDSIPIDSLYSLRESDFIIISRDGKPDIIINEKPRKNKKMNRKTNKDSKETKKLRDKIKDLFKKKNKK